VIVDQAKGEDNTSQVTLFKHGKIYGTFSKIIKITVSRQISCIYNDTLELDFSVTTTLQHIQYTSDLQDCRAGVHKEIS
jgi:hypothetical protein